MTWLVQTLTVVLLAGAPPAGQSAGLTLDQAVAEALRAEPGLQAVRAGIDAARGEQRQAALRPNPDVSFEQREQAAGGDRQTTIGVELPLDLFRRSPRRAIAATTVARADADVRDRERLLAASVRDRYGEAVAASRRVEIIDAVTAVARQTYELLLARVAEGAAPPLDRDLAQVELRRLEAERALERGRAATTLTSLKSLLGRPSSASLVLADSLESLAGRAEAADAQDTGRDRADVEGASAGLELARAQSLMARQERKPELTLFGSYMRMDAGFPQSGLGAGGLVEPIHAVFHNVAAGVRVSLPLFNRGQGVTAVARARETAAAFELAGRRLAVDQETASARARLDAAHAAVTAYGGETRTLARRNLDVMRETYSLGRATLVDVLNEQRRFLEFEAAYTAALAEAFAAAADLDRAKGAGQ